MLAGVLLLVGAGTASTARGEAMLQLFNVNWDELTAKMPEIAEAGYTSLWLPPPAKAGSVFSVGYDLFDPFDLGDKNQRGTIRTKYGTKDELLRVVETAHRFGLRVYFDNIMNHRGFDIPGFNSSTPTNLYPGMVPGDFHLKTVGSYFQNWPSVSDWNNVNEVQRQPLFGLVDIANEDGALNLNYGNTLNSTATKPVLIRQPTNFSYYMDTNLPVIAGAWRPFNGNNGDPVPEDVNAYLIRAALWMVNETKCDGFRFDAVKHVPSTFFGSTSANADGYTGAIQSIFDAVHGYGNNVLGNGYVEADSNRNSCFDTEATRNDAMLFGEHLGQPPGFQEYIDRGMRLLGAPLHFHLNNVFGNPSSSLAGLEQRDPSAASFSPVNSVLFAQSHDDGFANKRELHNAYNFFHEGLPSIFSDGYNQATANPGEQPFPRNALAPYLGQFGDNKMPEVAYLHHQLARGGTRPRWGDADIVAFERYDYREPGSAADQTVVLFALNDNYGFPGDVAFVDGEGEAFPSGVNRPPGVGADSQGLAVSFPPGSVLAQLAVSAPGYERTYKKVTVRNATNSRATAQASGGSTVYVGSQVIPAGGGAIEILVPSGGYVAYGYQWPEASRANRQDAITLRQGTNDAARITVYRRDGVNGDAGFNPIYPYRMRGSVDPQGNTVGGVNLSNRTYAITVPLVTNAAFDLLFRVDGSANNILAKLDGGIDLNSHMNLGSTNADKRDNRPGAATDVFLGFEQTEFRSRYGAEKFAALVTNRNNTVSDGAETYHYTVGNAASNRVINANGNDWTATTGTATWAIHSPSNAVNVTGGVANQRFPLNPTNGQAVDIYIRAGFQFQVNRGHLYYTTDGSNPEGAFGVGRGTTKVVAATFVNDDLTDGTIDWWKATIPGSEHGANTQIRYKFGLFNDFVLPVADNDNAKLYGLTTFAITNFNPTTATVWLHNNRNTNHTTIGLAEGFHIVRARTFLPRDGKSSVFNTFAQTFYYDSAPPTGVVAFPATNGTAIAAATYQVVVRADSSVTGVEFNILDGEPLNDDSATGITNGNGNNAWAPAAAVTPNAAIGQSYPNLPVEYRFNYVNIPTTGTATINVRLREVTTDILTNRVTIVSRTVNTLAPQAALTITDPGTNGAVLVMNTNTLINIRTCFTDTLTTNDATRFTLLVNGQPQTVSSNNFRTTGCGSGLRLVFHPYSTWLPGLNVIQMTYSNIFTVSDTRSFYVVRPGDTDGDGLSDLAELYAGTDPDDAASVLRITGLENGNQLVVWDSVPGVNYQVLASTNLAEPFAVLSPVLPASGTSSFYYDNTPDPTNKFYRIQVVP